MMFQSEDERLEYIVQASKDIIEQFQKAIDEYREKLILVQEVVEKNDSE